MIEHAYKVYWGPEVDKTLKKIPMHIRRKYYTWVAHIELEGLEKTQKQVGLHDEPLKGNRWGQRSIRLNRSYRVIYELSRTESIKSIEVKEVTKHEY
ncbi:MAG: hypothetical protein A2Z91_05860 [Deltaproteobacteria bacterium GWA2_38_16]|nr:MAG: hypothetical protein A2Z91_05860 [Deltaproteobacteria bacterium GWA2_38_16]OGQ02637.1 MAG: hypothetical protein A3D19_05155 [Deltaproteobacteria bacterium RIFCSPHIGHO2_02_FULL_38_15]OGQ30350.1 MAG: hypothetical protein A3A72_01195 [Deltaproteobacteria bacterium RIFCSPLOWO2_01_FULL_38_9]HBQ20336.1 hypothetical protein [Deltaproteobacteria bacterium]